MKRFFYLLLLCHLAWVPRATGQKVTLPFMNGQLTLPGDGSIDRLKADTVAAIFNDPVFDSNAVRAANAELAGKIKRTIRNLSDTALHLESFYDKIWNTPELPRISNYIAGLETIAGQLETWDTSGRAATIAFPGTYGNYIRSLARSGYSSSFSATPTDHILKVYYKHPYKQWFMATYNADVKRTLDLRTADIGYLNGWRELEKLYSDYKTLSDSLIFKIDSGLVSPDLGLTEAQQVADLKERLHTALAHNEVIGLLRDSFYVRWLWYTEGIPVINPLAETNREKEYPATEPFRFKETVRSSDLLLTSQRDQMKQLIRIRNTVTLPRYQEGDKTWAWNFDYARGFKIAGLDNKKLTLGDEHDIRICVHNVPGSQLLLYKQDTISIPASNSVVTSLGEAADNLSALFKGLAPLKTTLVSLTRSVTPNPVNPDPNLFALSDKDPKSMAEGWTGSRVITAGSLSSAEEYTTEITNTLSRHREVLASAGYSAHLAIADTSLKSLARNAIQRKEALPEITDYVERDGYIYYLTTGWKVDKALILAQHCYYMGIKLPPKVIAEFLRTDKGNNIVDYEKANNVVEKTEQLFNDFAVYLKRVNTSRRQLESLNNSIQDDIIFLRQLLTIPGRNLPAAYAAAAIPDSTEMSSYSFPLKGYTNKKITYTLSEKNRRGDTTTRVLFTEKVNMGKWQLFDVSAGIAFTCFDYERRTINDVTKLQEVTNDNGRVAAIAGLHFYPWKLYRRDERIAYKAILHRLSLYAGVNIVKPLEHFYPGICVDIIPGIKWINGVHLYKNTRYDIFNGQILNKQDALKPAWWYTSLSIDPSIFIKIFSL